MVPGGNDGSRGPIDGGIIGVPPVPGEGIPPAAGGVMVPPVPVMGRDAQKAEHIGLGERQARWLLTVMVLDGEGSVLFGQRMENGKATVIELAPRGLVYEADTGPSQEETVKEGARRIIMEQTGLELAASAFI